MQNNKQSIRVMNSMFQLEESNEKITCGTERGAGWSVNGRTV